MNKVQYLKYVLFWAALFQVSAGAFARAPQKVALIIGIGTYQTGNGWNTLHADADVDLIKSSLIKAGFNENSIATLKNEQATKTGITSAFKSLLQQINSGDVVVFHFSGHGQQLEDLNGDEADKLDEVLVPFDAPAEVEGFPSSYNGHKHLIDDELGDWFQKIRSKIGSDGQLIALVDACYSGTVSRGNGIVRGGVSPMVSANFTSVKAAQNTSGYFQATSSRQNNVAPFVLFSGAQANQPNYEYAEKEIGSLTYAVAYALDHKIKSSQSTFRDLYEFIRNEMAVIVPHQTPDIEGDKDAVIFGGSMVVQEPFYSVKKIEPDKAITISGGSLLGIAKGAQVGFFPIGTRSKNNSVPLVTAKVTGTTVFTAKVVLDKPFPLDSVRRTRVFLLQEGYSDLRTRVFLDRLPESVENAIKEKAGSKQVVFVADRKEASLFVSFSPGANLVKIASGNEGIDIVNPVNLNSAVALTTCSGEERTMDAVSYVSGIIKNFAVNNIIKTAKFSDENYNVKFELSPARLDQLTGKADTLSRPANNPVFNTAGSQALLRITNTGVGTGYVYVVEFDPSGKVCPLLGLDQEIRLEPGRKYEVPIEHFVPPYGKYIVKTFITSMPIGNELGMILNQQSNLVGRNGTANNITGVLADLMDQPAAARGGIQATTSGGTAALYSYEIQEN